MKNYCNVLAQEKGLDPVGHATPFDTLVLMESPLPWKKNMYETAGTMPQEVCDLFQLYRKRYQETGVISAFRPLVVAPDEEYSQPDLRRVVVFERQGKMIARFDRTEYLLPESEMGKLIWTLAEARDDLPRYERYRVDTVEEQRDLLVCTHGTVDAACAKFGYPLYDELRRNYADQNLRVWRTSHFGGHVFAPTFIDMPTGHYWGYVEAPQAKQIVERSGDVSALRGHYRGWAGLSNSFIQAAERELWQQYGWAWFDYLKSGELVEQAGANVRIDFVAPDGSIQGAYEMCVEAQSHIETIATTGHTEPHQYPQYVVNNIGEYIA